MEKKTEKIEIYLHEHILKFVGYKDKSSPAYSGGWICNICNKHFSSKIHNFYCEICNFDICQDCLPED